MATAPEFVTINPDNIVADLVAFYENETGVTLQPAQIERLTINMMAYREQVILNAIQSAAVMQLVRFSKAPILDYLGELMGVTRLSDEEATTRIELTLVNGHGALVIQQGIRIGSTDGQVYFTIDENTPVAAGVNTVVVNVTCGVSGVKGNGYAPGTVSVILDPQAYLSAASNLDTTAGGAEVETDDAYRERIMLAPSTFSVAGPRNAYKFWAKTANANIIDVSVVSPSPGVVNIYPLMSDAQVTPQSILDAVFAICNADDIRPLTDTVNVLSPAAVPYAIEIELTLLDDADPATAQAAAQTALEAYKAEKQSKLGKDVVLDQIKKVAMVNGVYKANIVLPAADLVIDPNSFAQCTSVTVTVVGLNEG
jgi:phage-related baseplate assembly protein